MLVVETDKFAHTGYDKHDEEIRYSDVAMIYSGKFVWLRFNIDNNKEARGSKTDLKHKLGGNDPREYPAYWGRRE